MKKNVTRIIALMTALLLLLCGCSGKQDDVGGSLETIATVSQTIPETTAAPETTVPETTVPETTVPETTAPAAESNLSLGRMEGGIYTNTYVGFSCQLDENWSFYSAEEIQELPAAVADAMAGSELGEALANIPQFTDMMAENVNDLTSMNVLYQQLSMQERIAYAMLTEEEIIDATLAQMDMMIEAYGQMGITVEKMEKVTVTFLGQTRTALHTTAFIQDVPYFTLQLFDYHLGEYSVTTTLASYVEDNTTSLLELFAPVE